jgi:P-type conjugative transfer protein TrbG
MRNRIIAVSAILSTMLLATAGAAAQQNQPQPTTPSQVPANTPTKGVKPSGQDSAVPSPEKYPFSEALKKLQNQDVPKPPHPASAVPPLTLVPMPPAGPRSKDVPRDYVPKKDVALNQTGEEAVVVSRQWQEAGNIPAPGKDGRVVYVYGAGMPVVVCSPLHICVVELQEGEKLVGEPQIGDSVRWQISPATVGRDDGAIPLVVIKPTAAGLDTTMMIPTDRRAYYLRLQSKPDDYLARVAFSYPQDQDQEWKRFEQQQSAARAQKDDHKDGKVLPDAVDVVYWDYAIKGGDPSVRPIRVLDDGVKTYIQMPVATQRTEAPVLVVEGPDGGEMVNYRVKGDVYVVDRLFNRAALIVGAGKHVKKVQITRRTQIGGETKSAQKGGGV